MTCHLTHFVVQQEVRQDGQKEEEEEAQDEGSRRE